MIYSATVEAHLDGKEGRRSCNLNNLLMKTDGEQEREKASK